MAFTYTDDQLKVISLRNRNILVSAAAGSGKTTVLVERIIRMISDESHPVDIDRLLIVTFTNAAAAQMREKIGNAIAGQLKINPMNAHLQRQATLLHNALITTIHSFCLFLIRNNFNEIGLDPGFRVADEGEMKLLRETVMERLLEECFKEADPAFIRLAERFITGNTMNGLAGVIQTLYNQASSYPFLEEWLQQRKLDYAALEETTLNESDWMKLLLSMTRSTVEECILITKQNLVLCEQTDGPYMYVQALESDLLLLQSLEKCYHYEEYYSHLNQLEFTRLPAKKDDSVSADKKEQAKDTRNLVKSMLTDLKKKYYAVSIQGIIRGMKENADILSSLADTTLTYSQRLTEEKREKKLIDFGDMEHLALQILLTKDGDSYVPSRAALDYREYFTEIMVDEYQDSNLVQEWILKTISGEAGGHFNRFMVGDVKQSIYKFRLARPELFMEKYDTYSLQENTCQRIDLSRNYRSRQEVVDSVNYLFTMIMGKDLGNIEYDEQNALHCGAVYPDNPQGNQTELLLLQREDGNISKQQQEARMIAGKIRELVGKFSVTDEKSGTLRKASYGDIVILLRTNNGWDEEFRRVFEEEGIPSYITSKTGYFSAAEIRVIMNFLRILDNPRQDIPLFGSLHSSFGGMSEEELAAVSVCRGENLYEKLCACAAYTEDEDKTSAAETLYREQRLPVEKSRHFIAMLKKYRDMVAYVPIHKVIRSLLNETGYLYEVAAMPGGEQRTANVNMLLTKAETYEKSSYSGLFHFIRYMEKIQKYDVDFGEAGTLEENADVVRIMSIHKSKGLEFPICFVAGLSKQFNRNDMKETVICDTDYGIAFDYADTENRVRYADLRKKVLAERIWRESLGEELRVLYVALTRAREKLILSASVDDFAKLAKKFQTLYSRMGDNGRLPFSLRTSAASYLDLLLPCFLPVAAFQEKFQDYGEFDIPVKEKTLPILVTLECLDTLMEKTVKKAVSTELLREQLNAQLKENNFAENKQRLKDQLRFCYSHDNLSKLYTKTTVSELKMAAMHAAFIPDGEEEKAVSIFPTEIVSPCIPRFAKEKEEVSGSTRGSAYHRVMELLDIAKIMKKDDEEGKKQEMIHQLEQFRKKEQMAEEDILMVNMEKLLPFFHTALAERMAGAQEKDDLYKEQPFVLGVKASRLSEDFPEEEQVLIQGIIDVFFIEEDEIVLMDYKTDVVSQEQELVDKYRTQLDYYQESLERITGKKVKERIIYSFYLEKEIWL